MDAMTIPEMLRRRVSITPDVTAHYTMTPSGKWKETTWKDYYSRVCELNNGFQTIGLKPHDNVGIMVNTSQTWEYIQMAVLMNGGVVVGIDPAEIRENVNHIVRRANLAGLFVQSTHLLEKIEPELLSQFKFIVSVEECSSLETSCFRLRDIDTTEQNQSIMVKPDDLATIIFTSGTTGEPKGIAYTHAQVTMTCKSILKGFPDINSKSNLPCWLPLSNLFQRIINFCAIDIGASCYFIENPREIINLLPQIQPHLFIGVPRVFEKLHAAIEAQISMKPKWQRWIIELAIKVGDIHARSTRDKKPLPFMISMLHKIMDKAVLEKIRSFLGSHIRYLISGSAPMPQWLLERYHALGILVLEAYGISENIIPNAMNIPSDFRFGTVGKPLAKNSTRLLEDGELLVKGPGLFSGYYNDLNQKDIFTPDGFFPTGDYASFDKDGFLSITGRKSELFKTSTGRKIAPVSIENRLQRLSYVEHAVLFGRGRKFLTAIVTISPDNFEKLLSKTTLETITRDMIVEIEQLPDFKRPAGIFITDSQLTVDKGELTSNMKLKRKNIESHFIKNIEQMYNYLENGREPETLKYYKSNTMVLFYSILQP